MRLKQAGEKKKQKGSLAMSLSALVRVFPDFVPCCWAKTLLFESFEYLKPHCRG